MHCGKTADRTRMPFRIVGRTGSQMRQVVGFGDQSTGRGTFGGEFRSRHCNQWGLYGVRVRSALTVGAVVWGRACGGPKHCCIRWGPTSCKGNGTFGGVPHFHNGKCHWVADREMFPIRVRKLHISVRQTYRWKARLVGFLAIYSVSRSTLGFMRN